MFLRPLFTILIFFAILLCIPRHVAAINAPEFPVCANPNGTVIASYENGIHGIVGEQQTRVGADTVYQLNNEAVLQCFCGPDGVGIQTNWWKIPDLSTNEIRTYESQGWHFIADGSVWGLSSGAYLAYNTQYSCKGGVGGAEIQSTTSNTTKETGDVLGLAATGDWVRIYGIFALASLFFLLGIGLLKHADKS